MAVAVIGHKTGRIIKSKKAAIPSIVLRARLRAAKFVPEKYRYKFLTRPMYKAKAKRVITKRVPDTGEIWKYGMTHPMTLTPVGGVAGTVTKALPYIAAGLGGAAAGMYLAPPKTKTEATITKPGAVYIQPSEEKQGFGLGESLGMAMSFLSILLVLAVFGAFTGLIKKIT